MVSFDLSNCKTESYDIMHNLVKRNFLKSCHILSTTYLIYTNLNEDQVVDWFTNRMNNKDNISLCVVKYISHQYWLSENVRNCIKKIHE